MKFEDISLLLTLFVLYGQNIELSVAPAKFGLILIVAVVVIVCEGAEILTSHFRLWNPDNNHCVLCVLSLRTGFEFLGEI